MKIYQFEFNCNKDTAIKEILHDVEKPAYFLENEVVYGKQKVNN